MDIKQIKQNKANGQKLICVSKQSDLKAGDYVILKKVEEI